jgi:hypothetical protein
MAPLFCSRMIGIAYFAARMQLLIDRDAIVERGFGDRKQFSVAAGETDTDIIVEDVEAAPAARRFLHHRLEVAFSGDVGFKGNGLAAFGFDQADGFPRGRQIAIHAQHASAFARKGDRGGAAIAHAFAGALAGADHDCRTIFQPHVVSLPQNWMPCRHRVIAASLREGRARS